MTDVLVCSDRAMLAALHTCLLSAVESSGPLRVHLLHEGLSGEDIRLLQETAGNTELLEHPVDPQRFEHFPRMSGSLAPYFRLVAPLVVPARKFVYLDTDTLVGVDLADIAAFDLGGEPVALVPEAPAELAIDTVFRSHPATAGNSNYYNTGVALIDSETWRACDVSGRCLSYLDSNEAPFFDQTALNIIVGRHCPALPGRFNRIANQRQHWPLSLAGNILHLVDRPKPWDVLGRRLHPQAHLWWPQFKKTALAGRLPSPARATGGLTGYQKVAKDFLLTSALRAGLVQRVKGMP